MAKLTEAESGVGPGDDDGGAGPGVLGPEVGDGAPASPGLLVPNPKGNPLFRNPDTNPGRRFDGANSRIMAARRWSKARRAAQVGVLSAARGAGVRGPDGAPVSRWESAWGAAVGDQYLKLRTSPAPDAGGLQKVGQALGAVPIPGEIQAVYSESAPAPAGALVLPAGAADKLFRLLVELGRRQASAPLPDQDVAPVLGSDVAPDE